MKHNTAFVRNYHPSHTNLEPSTVSLGWSIDWLVRRRSAIISYMGGKLYTSFAPIRELVIIITKVQVDK